jgi:hypothetical protein
VSGGAHIAAYDTSSQPTTLASSGTRRPSAASRLDTPSAISRRRFVHGDAVRVVARVPAGPGDSGVIELHAGCAGVGHGTATSLLAKLAAAQSDLDVGSSASAVQDLTVRVDEANARSGKHVSSAQAHAIVDEARTRLDAIGILQG